MGAGQQFIDSFGFSWQVCEIGRQSRPASPEQSGRAGAVGALYFFCRGATRVLTQYPREWRGLSWAELEDLCASAAVLGTDGATAVLIHPGRGRGAPI